MLMKMQIIDIDYFLNNNKPVVRIFGKTEDGTSVCCMYDKLLPYFYIRLNGVSFDKALDEMEKIKEIKDAQQVEKFIPFGYQKQKTKLVKVILLNPQDVPNIREKLLTLGIANEVYEADIMFKYRFMVDNEIYGMQWVEIDAEPEQKTIKSKVRTYRINSLRPIEKQENTKLKYLAFDIECIPSDPKRPLDAKHDPIVMISISFSPEYKGQKDTVLIAKPYTSSDAKGFTNEKEMLEEFIRIVDSYDPDVLTGYNINSFDFPYIVERLKQNKIPANLGRADKDVFSRTYGITQEYVVTGRVVVDPYQILKRDPWVKFHRYDLNTVAKKLLNEEKIGVEYGEMAGMWNGGKEQLTRFIEYARKDAELSLKLVLNRRLLDKFFELSKISGLLLQDVFGGQTRRIEIMLLHEFRKREFVMPESPSGQVLQKRLRERKTNELKGATVLEPQKGLHAEGCIIVLDFKSLYPSIMRTYNISPDSVLLDRKDVQNIKCHKSPAGAYFVDSSVYQGIFPYVLTKLLETRGTIKRLMKTKSGEEKRILNAKQLALKDISNSFYGYTGYVRARLYMIDVANSITGYGRDNIEMTKKLVEDNFDVKVVYGDSITRDRFVTLLNNKNFIEVKNIEELFEQHKNRIFKTPDGKERILLDGYKALTINQETKEAVWANIKEIIRHKTNKKIYRVSQKFGETVVTEDHSIITDNKGVLEETRPLQLRDRRMVKVENIPETPKITRIDLYEFLKDYVYEHEYKGRIKLARFQCDDNYVWFGWANRKIPIKIRRFMNIDSEEFNALCKLIGAYIAEGSSSTMETTTRYGCSIACSDIKWLQELQEAYQLLFEDGGSCIVQSSQGIRELSYGDKKILYEDKTYKLQMMNSLAAAIFKVLCGQKSYNKKIPGFMFHVPIDKQNIMLQHMLKGDGYIEKSRRYSDRYKLNNFRYDTKSLNLASCLSLLLTLHGKKHTIKFRRNKKVYRITTCSKYNNNLRTTISEEVYDRYVYDLSVDGSHMFVDACGQILLHNTDSLFVKTTKINLDEVEALGKQISKFVTDNLPGYLELEFEKIYRTFLILSKKRYAGWKFERADGTWQDEIEMRGIETVRRDWCSLVSETMMEVLSIILKEGDLQKSIQCVKDILDKLRAGKIPLEKLTIIKGITQSLDTYKGILPHIELARKLAERNPYDPPKVGDRIGFVIVKGNQMLSKRAEDPRYVEENKIPIDSDYYIQSQLFPPIERIFSAVGIERSEVLGNGHQTRLGDMLLGRKRTMKHEINIDYSSKTLEGWEEFVCKKCSKSYRRMPLQGICECGGELLISYHGSVGGKISLSKE